MNAQVQGGDGDVTCWKCGFQYSLQRKFCVKCGSKPTRPGSTPGSPAPSPNVSVRSSPSPAPTPTPSSSFNPRTPSSSASSSAIPAPQPTPASAAGAPVHVSSAPSPAPSPSPTPVPAPAPRPAPTHAQTAATPSSYAGTAPTPSAFPTPADLASSPSPSSSSSPSPSSSSSSSASASCAECGSELSGTVATDAAGRSYHQACFKCCTCGKVLTGNYHVTSGADGKDRFYCTEDFVAVNSPVCAACAKPITGNGAEDHTGAKYHLQCFACKRCGTPITSKYIVDSKGDLCCGHCHSSAPPAAHDSAFRCGVCDGELEGQVVGVGDTRYHKHCFVCPICKTDLTNAPFHLENGQLRCKRCLLTEKGEFCAACTQLIEDGALQAMSKLWHENCFKCGDCANVIGAGQSYAAKGQTPICADCAAKY